MRRTLPPLLVCSLLLGALPAAAEVFTIKLTNGTSFESRYRPKQAPFDANMVIFIDEMGLELALPKSLLADVSGQLQSKGFGLQVNSTTIDLGFAPNDVDETRRAQQRLQAGALDAQLARSFDQQQFVEPEEAGGGFSMGGGAISGYGGGGPTVPEGGTAIVEPPLGSLTAPAAPPAAPAAPPGSPQ